MGFVFFCVLVQALRLIFASVSNINFAYLCQKISKLSNVIKKFELNLSLVNCFNKATFDFVFVT